MTRHVTPSISSSPCARPGRWAAMALLCVVLAVPAGRALAENQPDSTEPIAVKVPFGAVVHSFSASADGRYALVLANTGPVGAAAHNPQTCLILDRKWGRAFDVTKAVPADLKLGTDVDIYTASLSPDGETVLLALAAADDTPDALAKARLIAIPRKGKMKTVLTGQIVYPRWSGKRAYLDLPRSTGKATLLTAFDTEAGKTLQLPVAGAFVGADPAGKFVIVGCDEKAPTRALATETLLRDGAIMVLSADGNAQRKLCRAAAVYGRPVTSPQGKFIAFARASKSGGRIDQVAVIDTADPKNVTLLATTDGVAAVLDDGRVITLSKDRQAKLLAAKAEPKPLAKQVYGLAVVAGTNLLVLAPDQAGKTFTVRLVPLGK